MCPAPQTMWIRLPDHLGDTILALPALEALAHRGPGWLAGPAPCRSIAAAVFPGAPGPPPRRVDTAVLLKPALRALFSGPRAQRRVGLATDHRWWGLRPAVVPGGDHRQQDFDRVARAAGAQPRGLPRLPLEWMRPAPPTRPDTVLLLPLSRTGATVQWPGFRALADALETAGRPPLFAAGPGEEAQLAAIAGPHAQLPALPLPVLASVAVAARAVVGNDSGLTHLAAAARRGAGRDVGAVIGVRGSTDPASTGAPGATWLSGPGPSCWPCYRARCSHDLDCLAIPPGDALQAVLARFSSRPGPAAPGSSVARGRPGRGARP